MTIVWYHLLSANSWSHDLPVKIVLSTGAVESDCALLGSAISSLDPVCACHSLVCKQDFHSALTCDMFIFVKTDTWHELSFER